MALLDIGVSIAVGALVLHVLLRAGVGSGLGLSWFLWNGESGGIQLLRACLYHAAVFCSAWCEMVVDGLGVVFDMTDIVARFIGKELAVARTTYRGYEYWDASQYLSARRKWGARFAISREHDCDRREVVFSVVGMDFVSKDEADFQAAVQAKQRIDSYLAGSDTSLGLLG